MVEQLTLNQLVLGSSPRGATNFPPHQMRPLPEARAMWRSVLFQFPSMRSDFRSDLSCIVFIIFADVAQW